MNTRLFLLIIITVFCIDSLLRSLRFARGWRRTIPKWISGCLHLALIIPTGMLFVHILGQNLQPIVWIAGHWIRSSEVSIPIFFQFTHNRLLMIGTLFLLHAFESLSESSWRNDPAQSILRNVSIVAGTLMIVSGSLIQIAVLSFLNSLFLYFLAARVKQDNDAATPGSSIWFTLALSDVLLLAGAVFTSRICGTTDFQVLFRVMGIYINQIGGPIFFWALLPLFVGLLIRSFMFVMFLSSSRRTSADLQIIASALHCLSLPSLVCLIDLQTNLFNTVLFKSILESLCAIVIATICVQSIRFRSRFGLHITLICLMECIVLLMFYWGFPGVALLLFMIVTLSMALFIGLPKSVNPMQSSFSDRLGNRILLIGIPLIVLLLIQPAIVMAIERRDWWTAACITSIQCFATIAWSVVTAGGSRLGIDSSGEDVPADEESHANALAFGHWVAFFVAAGAVVDLIWGLDALRTTSEGSRTLFFGAFHWTPVGLGIAMGVMIVSIGIYVWARLYFERRHQWCTDTTIATIGDFDSNRIVSLIDTGVFYPVIRIGRILWEIDRVVFMLLPESTVQLIGKGCSILSEFDRFGRHMIEARGIPGLIDRCTHSLEFVSRERSIRNILIIGLLSGLIVLAGFVLLAEGF